MKRNVLKTLAVAMAVALVSVLTLIPVYADDADDDMPLVATAEGESEPTDDAAPTETEATTEGETKEETKAETKEETTAPTETKQPVSDLSNIIGIVVAVVIAVAAIAAVIILAPKKTGAAKKK